MVECPSVSQFGNIPVGPVIGGCKRWRRLWGTPWKAPRLYIYQSRYISAQI